MTPLTILIALIILGCIYSPVVTFIILILMATLSVVSDVMHPHGSGTRSWQAQTPRVECTTPPSLVQAQAPSKLDQEDQEDQETGRQRLSMSPVKPGNSYVLDRQLRATLTAEDVVASHGNMLSTASETTSGLRVPVGANGGTRDGAQILWGKDDDALRHRLEAHASSTSGTLDA